MWLELVKTIAVLIGVLGLIFLMAWGAKKLGLGSRGVRGGVEGWRVLGTKAIAPRKQICVVEVGKQILLVGITEKAMTALMQIDDPKNCEALAEAIKKEQSAPSFRDFLKRAQS